MNTKKNIALITGGYTQEKEISYKSAANVFKNIDKDLFNTWVIDITREGWVYKSENGTAVHVDKNDFSLNVEGEKITFDLVYNCIHGSPGEDGHMQAYFDLLNIKYTGCSMAASVITMNKTLTKELAREVPGVHVAKAVLYPKQGGNMLEIQQLTLPLFVKPNSGGSSFAMSKVIQCDKLKAAVELALAEDDDVLVEEFIEGREFTIGVVNLKGAVIALPFTEVITKHDFFNTTAKYTPGEALEITPAEVRTETKEMVESIAKGIYTRLNCRGMVRMDFILKNDEAEFYLIEVNTVPGQTDTSFIPQQARAAGYVLKEFYTELIHGALHG